MPLRAQLRINGHYPNFESSSDKEIRRQSSITSPGWAMNKQPARRVLRARWRGRLAWDTRSHQANRVKPDRPSSSLRLTSSRSSNWTGVWVTVFEWWITSVILPKQKHLKSGGSQLAPPSSPSLTVSCTSLPRLSPPRASVLPLSVSQPWSPRAPVPGSSPRARALLPGIHHPTSPLPFPFSPIKYLVLSSAFGSVLS